MAESDKFINELSSITQKEKVQSLLQEVNSGRIRLTESMLDSSAENNFQNSFNRSIQFFRGWSNCTK